MDLRVGIAAGLVLLADDDDAVGPTSEPRPCRPGGLLGGDEHPGGGRAPESCGETIGTARAGAGEEATGVDERQQRGNHRVVGADRAVVGLHDDLVGTFPHPRRPTLLVDRTTAGDDRRRQRCAVAVGVKVQLVVKPHCGADVLEGDLGGVGENGGKSEAGGDRCLPLDIRDARVVGCIDVRR